MYGFPSASGLLVLINLYRFLIRTQLDATRNFPFFSYFSDQELPQDTRAIDLPPDAIVIVPM